MYVHYISVKQEKKKKNLTIRKTSFYALLRLLMMSAVPSCSVMSDSLQTHGLWAARLLYPWNSPCKNTAVDCHVLLQCW